MSDAQHYRTKDEVEEYKQIDLYCNSVKIEWFASAWDLDSQNFLNNFGLLNGVL